MVEVFCTNIPGGDAAADVARTLRGTLGYANVSCDVEDCDRVLRVEADAVDAAAVMALLRGLGLACAVMEG